MIVPDVGVSIVASIRISVDLPAPLGPSSPVKQPEKSYDYGVFRVNPSNVALTVNGEVVECTAKEYELLLYFCKNPNRVFTLTQLYEAVWDTLSFGDEKTVTMHISKLRKKLGDDAKSPSIIVNMRGIGYKFIPPVKE